MRMLLLKAVIHGGAASDLFATPVQVEGYTTKGGTYVATHRSVRHKRPEEAPKAPDLFSQPAKPKPYDGPVKDDGLFSQTPRPPVDQAAVDASVIERWCAAARKELARLAPETDDPPDELRDAFLDQLRMACGVKSVSQLNASVQHVKAARDAWDASKKAPAPEPAPTPSGPLLAGLPDEAELVESGGKFRVDLGDGRETEPCETREAAVAAAKAMPAPPAAPATVAGKAPPEAVMRRLRLNLDTLQETAKDVERIRATIDGAMAGGGGRYEAELLEKRATDITNAREYLERFRKLAAQHGVDADATIQQLGGVPDLTPSPAAKAWMKDAPAPAEKPAAEPKSEAQPPVSAAAAESPAEPLVWGVAAGTKAPERRKLNKAAVALLNAKADADMTAEDRAILARYTGNGGCGDSLNEFYTEPAVAAAMWQMLANAGFRGGEVLEPSCGTGVFLHTAPAGARVTGVEIDGISSKIAGILHPAHDIRFSSFERFACQDGALFDAVIGNAPFGRRGGGIKQDPGKMDLTTHEDYFLDTSLDKLRDGGLMAMIVDTGVMNSSNGRGFRERLLRKAEFLGAHRLPNTAFAASHTDATTDILLFRKRPAEVAGALGTLTQDQLKATGVWDDDFLSGEYFKARGAPHVYGTFGTAMRAYGPIETVNGSMEGVADHLAAWSPDEPTAQPDMHRILTELDGDPKAQKRAADAALKRPYQAAVVGDVRVIDGVRYILQGDPPRWHRLETTLPDAVTDALRISEELSSLVEGVAKEPALVRAQVAESLDEYIAQHGLPNKSRDLAAWIVAPALEQTQGEHPEDFQYRVQMARKRVARLMGAVNKDGSYSDVITGNFADRTESGIDSAAARMSGDSPRFTAEQLAGESGRTAAAVLDHLHASPLYALDPDGKSWSTIDTYLSGELWPKLDAAKAAATHEGLAPEYRKKYEAQARMLEEAIAPASLEDTEVLINSGFITPEDMNAYFAAKAETWRLDNPGATWKREPIVVRYDDGVYILSGPGDHEQKMLDRLLNRTGVRKDERDDLEALNEDFAEWARTGPRRDEIEERYNRTTKGFRQLDYSEAPMVIPGLTAAFDINGYHYSGLRWAIATGKGIIADDVGLGKTARGLMLAKLAKLHGTARKPALVVPLAVLGNWAEETQNWFAGSRVLVIGETYQQNEDGSFKRDASGKLLGKSDTAAERQAKFHQLQQNDYDFVLISQPAWNKIDLDPLTKGRFSAEEFWNKRSEKLGNKGTKKVNAVRDAYDQAQAKRDFKDRENTIYFDDLGVDMLIMDEGHAYKNLFKTNPRFGKQPKFLGGSGESNTAMDTYFKSKLVREKNGGKGVYLLTATPTKNSPLEIYSMLSHIAPEAFERMGIKNSEDFIDRFVEFVPEEIYSVSGEYEDALVTAGFKNLGELREVMRRYISRRTADEVGLKLPEADNQEHLLAMSPRQEKVYQKLRADALASRQSKKDATGDAHIFSIMDKMQKASTDLRLLGKGYEKEVSPKLTACADLAVKNSEDGGQLIFCEAVDEHERIAEELVKRGVPRAQIGIINAVVTPGSADRQKVSDWFNDGRLRYVIGNKTMEQGVNLQKNTSDIHHLDLPWNASTLHQRNGRGRRQGNKRGRIRIHSYLAKKSFDVYRHQTIAAKGNWQDMLWHGGDRVENLERDGVFDLKDMSVMLADDPEAAAAKFASDQDAAYQRKRVSDRARAAESFKKFRNMKANLAKLDAAGRSNTEGALRLKMKADRTRELLAKDSAFPHKELLDSNVAAVIDPVQGVAWKAGMGMDVAPGPDAPIETHADKSERYIVAYVDEPAKKVYVRSLADNREFPVSLTAQQLQSGVTPFEATPEVKAAARAEFLATVGETEAEGAKTFEEIYRLPPETAAKHYAMLQARLKHGIKSWSDVKPDRAAMIGPDGKPEVVEKWSIPASIKTHDFMLPTPEHREAAIGGWVDARLGRALETKYSEYGRGHRGGQEIGIKAKYESKDANPWHEPIEALFGRDSRDALTEAKGRVTAKVVENVGAAKDLYEAFHAASKAVNLADIKRGGGWPEPVVLALYAKAKAMGNLDFPFFPQVEKRTRVGTSYHGQWGGPREKIEHAGHPRLYNTGGPDFLNMTPNAEGKLPTVRDFLAYIARGDARAAIEAPAMANAA
jgi:hypothetical protein